MADETLEQKIRELESKLAKNQQEAKARQNITPEYYSVPDYIHLSSDEKEKLISDAKAIGLNQDQFNSSAQRFINNKNDQLRAKLEQDTALKARYTVVGGEEEYNTLKSKAATNNLNLDAYDVKELSAIANLLNTMSAEKKEGKPDITSVTGAPIPAVESEMNVDDAKFNITTGLYEIAKMRKQMRFEDNPSEKVLMGRKINARCKELGDLADSHGIQLMKNDLHPR